VGFSTVSLSYDGREDYYYCVRFQGIIEALYYSVTG